mmetsp:Transcript_90238/g.254619  ORF Transcript_90238/g.254619 Transcript_90238/m.254619 type:complete len:771 (+) Transcript_90238:31-2343(+)
MDPPATGAARLRLHGRQGRNSWAPGCTSAEWGEPVCGGRSRANTACGGLVLEQGCAAAEADGFSARGHASAERAGFDLFSERSADADAGAIDELSRCDHIRVAVRVRPLPAGEDGIIDVAGAGAITIRKDAATGGNEFLRSQQGRIEERAFDRVFGPHASQAEVYAWCCAPLVADAIAGGRSATMFVYGATGAGKTHTMFGGSGPGQQGLIFRTIPEVFAAIGRRSSRAAGAPSMGCGRDREEPEASLQVKVSFLEIYNENVRDLLQDGPGAGQCRVLEDERRGVVKVANLVETPVQNAGQALAHLQSGMRARTIEATAANSQSSRAHAVFNLTIEAVSSRQQRSKTRASARGHPFQRDVEERRIHSRISLIDLAGSERAAFTQNSGTALKDGARINQSLLALANCIDALTARGGAGAAHRKKPPYRDSKLTLMLKSSLTGDGLVAMIANVHPGRFHFEDSNNTLEYARRASAVRTQSARRPPRTFRFAPMGPESPSHGCAFPGASGPHGVDSGCGQLRCSAAAAYDADGDGDGESPRGDAMATCTSSSSSRPPSVSEPLERRYIGAVRQSAPAALGGFARDHCSTTTASSSEGDGKSSNASSPKQERCDGEDCLSEISLPSQCASNGMSLGASSAGLRRPAGDEEGAEEACTSWQHMRRDSDYGNGFAVAPTPHDEKVGGPNDAELPALATLRNASDAQEGLELAIVLVRRLQDEKVQLDARLRAVVAERNAVLQDRTALEKANELLRAETLEKDKRLAQLLSCLCRRR